MLRALVLLCFSLPLCVGCGGDEARPAPFSYGKDAEEAYHHAMEDFRDGDCFDAEPQFRDIRRKYAYSRYAALAEIRVADCLVELDKQAQAIAEYRNFIRNRPSHELIPYARFRIAKGYYDQIPDGWFLSPPEYEMDQSATRDAIKHLREFIVDYPESKNAPEAREMVQKALGLLARHEFYVAEFYFRQDHFRAGVARLQTMIAAYPGSDLEPQALLMIGQGFLELGEHDRAKTALERLIREYPASEASAEARDLLGS